MDPNDIIGQQSRNEIDAEEKSTGLRLTTVTYRDGRKITYLHKPSDTFASGEVWKTTVDEQAKKDWLSQQKFEQTTKEHAAGQGLKEAAGALSREEFEQRQKEWSDQLKESEKRSAFLREKLDETRKANEAQNLHNQNVLAETTRQHNLQSSVSSERLTLSQEKNTFLQTQADAKAVALQEKNRLANLVSIGQLDVDSANKQFDNFTSLLGEITKGAQYSVEPGSEYFPGLGPGSTFARFTGQPARTGGTYDPRKLAMSIAGTPRSVPTVEEALAKAQGLQKQYDTTPQTAAAAIPPVQPNPMMVPQWNPESNMAPSTGLAPTPELQQIIAAASAKQGLDPALFNKLIQTESNFNPNASSPAGAQGLAQLMPETGRSLGVTNPFDPQQNADAGARYLKSLLVQYNYNPKLALAAYNAGPGAVQQYGGVPPFDETRRFLELMGYGG